MATPAIEITYFNIAGRAEPIRLCLAAGGVAFKDNRLSFPKWGEVKAAVTAKIGSPFINQLPALKVGDETMFQSLAMLRYAGRISKVDGKELFPSDALEALHTDSAMQLVDESVALVAGSLSAPADKLKEVREGLSDKIPKVHDRVEALLKKEGSGFLANGRLSVADLLLYQQVGWISSKTLDHLDIEAVVGAAKYPLIHKLVATVDAIPAIKAFKAQEHKECEIAGVVADFSK